MLQELLSVGAAYLKPYLEYNGCCCVSDDSAMDFVVAHGLEQDEHRYTERVSKVVSFPAVEDEAGYNDQPDAAQRCRQHDVEEASQQSTQCQSPRKERLQLREMMRVFVQEAVNGKSLEVVVTNGLDTQSCILTVTASLELFHLEVDGATHDIPITDIKEVYGGTSVARLCAEAAPVRLDERCATLALRSGECITFRMPSLRERDVFIKCVKILLFAVYS